MTNKIAVIDFPPEGKTTSYFVVNGAEGPGGLVSRIKDHGFVPELVAYNSPDLRNVDPRGYAAVFFASGFTQIRDYADGPNSKEINPDLEGACEIYDECVEGDVPVGALIHGSQVIAFHKGGNYSKLNEKRTRLAPYGKYSLAFEDAKDHWLLKDIPEEVLQTEEFAREFREYRFHLENTPFRALVYPDDRSTGPAIAVHEDPNIDVVLFMIQSDFNEGLPAYKLMENVFDRIRSK